MLDEILARLRSQVASILRERLQVPEAEITVDVPPSPDLGDLALPMALPLARTLKRNPREIAETIAQGLEGMRGIRRTQVDGP